MQTRGKGLRNYECPSDPEELQGTGRAEMVRVTAWLTSEEARFAREDTPGEQTFSLGWDTPSPQPALPGRSGAFKGTYLCGPRSHHSTCG